MASSTSMRLSPGSRVTGLSVSVKDGTGRGGRVSTPPNLNSSADAVVRNGCMTGGGVTRMMSGKGVVLPGTTSSSSAAEKTSKSLR